MAKRGGKGPKPSIVAYATAPPGVKEGDTLRIKVHKKPRGPAPAPREYDITAEAEIVKQGKLFEGDDANAGDAKVVTATFDAEALKNVKAALRRVNKAQVEVEREETPESGETS